jgi:uncharacterized protein (DUF4415 family)
MKQKKGIAKRKQGTSRRAAAKRARKLRELPADMAGLYRPLKKSITVRLDADILAWFKKSGRGYQTRINRALREWVMRERK